METIAYIPPSIFAAVRSTVNQEGGNPQPLETFPIPPEVKSIFSDSNMEIQIQMYGNLFVSITLINHGYASILIPFEPRSRYKVIPRLTVPAGTTCDKPKIVSAITKQNRVSMFRSENHFRYARILSDRVNEFQQLLIKAV